MSVKTSVYLPDEMKRDLEIEARRRGIPEAEMIREAIAALLAASPPRRQPYFGILDSGDPYFAERADDHLAGGFGADGVNW